MRGRRLLPLILLLGGLLLLAVIGLFLFRRPATPVASAPAAQDTPAATPDPNATPLPPGQEPSPTVDASAMVEVVVSLQTVPRGWQMTEAEVAVEMRRAADVRSNVITRVEDAVGLYARTDIYQGETLTKDALIGDPTLIGVENYGPSSLIPPGWVAIAVPMDRLSSVAYGLAPGDAIDVMLSFAFYMVDEEFQSLLQNSAAFFLDAEAEDEEGEAFIERTIYIVDPYGRFETLPNGDFTHIGPAEDQRPIPVSMILQNARVIQVGPWSPAEPVSLPTVTPTPAADAPTPPPSAPTPTATPALADVLLLAMPPQQQLLIKYGLEVGADVDFALRGVNDTELYDIENVDLTYLLQRFNIDVPPTDNYTLDPRTGVVATPEPAAEAPEGEGQ